MSTPGSPSASLVMAVGPVRKFLAESVESALGQTWPTQVVLVNDGGPPLDLEVATRGSTVSLVTLAHRSGPAAARNAGLRCADGDYVAVLDADDVADRDRIARQIATITTGEGLDLLGCSMRLIDASGSKTGTRRLRDDLTGGAARRLVFRNPLVHSGVLMSRSAAEAVGGYDESLPRFMDYDLYLRLALAGGRLGTSSEVVGSLRQHAGQLSRAKVPVDVRRALRTRRSDLGRAVGVPAPVVGAVNVVWNLRNGAGVA